MVIEAQVLADERDKVNRIKLVHAPQEAGKAAKELIGKWVNGSPAHKVLLKKRWKWLLKEVIK